MDLCNLSVIKSLMSEAGITFRKDYGQNFLINRIIPEEIAERCTDNPHSMILEIGPGIGCLTQELAMRFDRVVAVEIDKGLIPVLGKTLSEYDNVTVINNDVSVGTNGTNKGNYIAYLVNRKSFSVKITL